MKNNLYGTRQAEENSFDMLKTGLEDENFKQNKLDPYLFVKNDCIVVFYVDDCCIFSKYRDTIDALLKNLSKTFNLTDEGDVKSYLVMNARKYPKRIITMSQPAIIYNISNSLGTCNE